jgi:hypothetical protein
MFSWTTSRHRKTSSVVAVTAMMVLLTVSACTSNTDNYTYDETSVDTLPSVAPNQGYVQQICDEYVDMDCDGIMDEYDDDADGNYIDDLDEQETQNRQTPNRNNPWDADNDGVPDDFDIDAGNDGYFDFDKKSGFPSSPFDADNDGVPNEADWDIDGDGFPDNQW